MERSGTYYLKQVTKFNLTNNGTNEHYASNGKYTSLPMIVLGVVFGSKWPKVDDE